MRTLAEVQADISAICEKYHVSEHLNIREQALDEEFTDKLEEIEEIVDYVKTQDIEDGRRIEDLYEEFWVTKQPDPNHPTNQGGDDGHSAV